MAFTHLHLHTEYSLLDGACRIKPLIARIKALGMDSCAVTDHGVLYGAVEFYSACKDAGIKPIIGCEAYVCPDMDEKQVVSREYSHLVLLCENNTGYQNLMYLISEGFTRGFYYRPRIDYKLLEKHHEGLIALSACLSGDLPKLLLDRRGKDAEQYVRDMVALFGEGNFFIEIMDHGITEEKQVLPRLIDMARRMNVPLVATNDCHYLEEKDAAAQEALMCIQTGKTLADETRMQMHTKQLYVKSEQEMLALFPDTPDAVARTKEIADRCNVQFDFSTIHLPKYAVPDGETAESMLRKLCEEGFRARYPDGSAQAQARLEYELATIVSMGYVDYFLIVWDFIKYAKDNGIMVGPGRGSGAGSIVAYTLNITALDPLKYNLIFERFLNPERVTMPDIDIDFCYERRQEVIDYVARKYGQDHVSQIITFGTMAARGVIRDVGRVLGYSYQETDVIARYVPMQLDITLEKALKLNPDFAQAYERDERVKKLIDMALTLEGMPRHASTHAAGVLITREPVTHYVPLQTNDNVVTTQYPMGIIEKLGLLKMDFLGLRTLTVIRDTLDDLARHGVRMRPEDIPMDDKAVYDMISQGETDGVFQLESGGMRTFLSNMRPENFEDVIAAISLYRPGPMESIPRYIQGKHDPASVRYDTELLAPILDVTYGCMVYQEQVMQIVRDLAGYSMGRSDLVRRAMAKKKHDVMAKERQYFIYGLPEDNVPGAVKRGVQAEVAEKIFDDMTAFASYAFNKSHAAAYGVLSVQTAWLKCHHPAEFMAAIMNSVTGNPGKIAGYIQYCRKHDIRLLPPSVNLSERRFTVDPGGEGIRFGMGAIKNVGSGAVDAIVRERERGGFYKDIFDFCRRIDSELINRRCVESLILAGCFDGMGGTRPQCMNAVIPALERAVRARKTASTGQLSLFDVGQAAEGAFDDADSYPDVHDFTMRQRVNYEKELTGVYITGHPLDEYARVLDSLPVNTAYIADLQDRLDAGVSEDGRQVSMGGLVALSRQKATKKGAMMGFITLEDLTGQIECLLFPRVYERYGRDLAPDSVVLVTGKLSVREEEETKLIADVIEPLIEVPSAPKKSDAEMAKEARVKLYLRVTRAEMDYCSEVLARMKGNIPVYFNLPEENMTLLAPRALWCDDAEDARATLLSDIAGENMKVVKK